MEYYSFLHMFIRSFIHSLSHPLRIQPTETEHLLHDERWGMQSAPILRHRHNRGVDAMGVGKGLTQRRQDGHLEPGVSFFQEDNAFVTISKGLPHQLKNNWTRAETYSTRDVSGICYAEHTLSPHRRHLRVHHRSQRGLCQNFK